MPRTELAEARSHGRRPSGLSSRTRAAFAGIADRITLAAHRAADRFDLAPAEFGRDIAVDENDARSVRDEWLRHLKLWAAYNPEEIFALKVGGGLLAAAVIALWLAIALIL